MKRLLYWLLLPFMVSLAGFVMLTMLCGRTTFYRNKFLSMMERFDAWKNR